MRKIVIDTNVLISALQSQRGASHRLFQLIGQGQFEISLSVPLVLEYESVAKRLIGDRIVISVEQVDDVIDYLCTVGNHHPIFFLWRPTLPDPSDDMVLELAVSSASDTILTYNLRDFRGTESFGIRAITPREFLQEIGVLP